LTAAIYCRRAGKSVLVLEKETFGGQITYSPKVENYPGFCELSGAELGGVYTNPASHGEGRFVAPKEWIDKLFSNGQVATQYCDPDGNISMDEEWNINGSFAAIEGITSPDGRILGKMAHCERKGYGVNLNIYGEQDLRLFESGVRYFK
jgi:phosphoribosylformylglycinamidine synthase